MKRFTWRLTQLLVIPLLLALGALTMLSAVPTLAAGSGTWTLTGSLHVARADFTATLLPNGQVLVVGGRPTSYTPLASAELYNPATGTWTTTGSLHTARYYHTATLLSNGQVLVTGGYNATSTINIFASAELYNPAKGTWTLTSSMHAARTGHAATLLQNGQVLVVAGENNTQLTSAELYNPATGTWTLTGSLHAARGQHTATLLQNGQMLVAGGQNGSNFLASAERYNPSTGSWTTTGSLHTARLNHTATLLQNGQVLVAGGQDSNYNFLASAEVYTP